MRLVSVMAPASLGIWKNRAIEAFVGRNGFAE